MLLVNAIACCTSGGFVAGVFVLLGLSSMIAWKEICGVSWRRMFIELFLINTGLVASIIIVISAVCSTPTFSQEPIPTAVFYVFDALGVGFLTSAAVCLGTRSIEEWLAEDESGPSI